ncbi:MAG: SCO family protein [Sphingomonadales bacterium]|nr:SCO family protein [Sphingomonadales bacterium]NCQ22745.1 SCO family protein [Sphingomonadales bacterium]NCT05019.1 SCO family protein [Sphingomonadales bacterium]
MNRNNNPSPVLALMIAGALALAGCGAAPPAEEPPLAGAAIGGDFALTNSKGETVRWNDFAGKYRIVYFGYAFCPDVCPTDMQRVAQGLRVMQEQDPAKAAQIQPIFITIDPERDTQEVVGEFAAAFSPDIIGLTGTPEQIAATAKTFKIFYAKGEPLEGGGYLVDHSNIVYLFGPEGEPLATLPVDQGADAVAAELDRWVK